MSLDLLHLFNEKVELISNFDFTKYVESQRFGSIAEYKKGEGWESIYIGPKDEAIHASLMTIRLFIQNNEDLSLYNMSEVYNRLDVSDTIRNQFNSTRKDINDMLDAESNWSIEEEKKLTYREIFYIFIYGGISHTKDEIGNTYRELSKTAFFDLIKIDFVNTLTGFIWGVKRIREINLLAIEDMNS